mmetsp:Transcript_28625/g.46185  ORF Transcript_28625/g.46185 Transcript_28625/m.46185 type:complete len:530 (-) Transcript_28625:1003-2592(-)
MSLNGWLRQSVEKKKRPRRSGLVDCPICQRSFLESIIESHARSCMGTQQVQIRSKPVVIDLEEDEAPTQEFVEDVFEQDGHAGKLRKQVNCSPRMHKIGIIKPHGGKAGTNAFKTLMDGANIRPRLEMFVCDDALRCRWEVKERGFRQSDFNSLSLKWKQFVEFTKLWKVDLCTKKFKGVTVVVGSNKESRKEDEFSGVVGWCAEKIFSKGYSSEIEKWSSGATSGLTVSMLKSLLQKSIRRQLCGAALWCTCELLIKSRNELFRRVPIIVVEDAILSPEYDYLVWLMLASSKGYIPGRDEILKYLKIVWQIAVCGVFGDVDGIADDRLKTLDEDCSKLFKTSEKYATFVRCLICRSACGGMAGDIKLLLRFAAWWCAVFLHEIECRNGNGESRWVVVLRKIHSLKKQPDKVDEIRLPMSGIDFHCCPWTVDELVEATGLDGGDIKSAIWCFYSSLNNRSSLVDSSLVDIARLVPDSFKTSLFAYIASSKREACSKRESLKPVWDAIEPNLKRSCQNILRLRTNRSIIH